jgi:hypothetical protein
LSAALSSLEREQTLSLEDEFAAAVINDTKKSRSIEVKAIPGKRKSLKSVLREIVCFVLLANKFKSP